MPASRSLTSPSLNDFTALAKKHTLIPVTRTVAADLETPVSAFLRVAAHEPEAFLLESVEGGENVGRYTFIGVRPYKTLSSHNGQITVTESGSAPRTCPGDIFTELKSALAGQTPARLPGLPPFTGGAVGFFAYDVVRQIEKLPTLAADELHVPDAFLMFFDEVLAFDHVRKAIHLIVTAGARTPLKGSGPRAQGAADRDPQHRELSGPWTLDPYLSPTPTPPPASTASNLCSKPRFINPRTSPRTLRSS